MWLTIVRDGDGVPDAYDNCVDLPNGDQADADVDSVGTKRKLLLLYAFYHC